MNLSDKNTGNVTALPGTNSALSGSGFVRAVNDWLMERALEDTAIGDVVGGMVSRLVAAGIPIDRVMVGFKTLHPLYEGVSYIWEKDQELVEQAFHTGLRNDDPDWAESPMKWMLDNDVVFLRRHLIGPGSIVDFPVLSTFKKNRGTDYLALMTPFVTDKDSDLGRNHIFMTYLTKRSSGFTDEDLSILSAIQGRFAVACKMRIMHEETRMILETYLGSDAGGRVRNGQIKLGDGTKTRAVIWFSDMRNSTGVAATVGDDAFLGEMNAFFAATAGAVLKHGGQVLRYIGDATLAIFPIRDDEQDLEQACHAAVYAAAEAQMNIEQLNLRREESGMPGFDYGLGMHVGDVVYGNVGVPERVDFTVVGRAANEAARIEKLTKKLGKRVLVSGPVARFISCPTENIGEYELEGTGTRLTLFAPDFAEACQRIQLLRAG
ncbi:adenylate/guanylate cyclase domain-containing protein [Thalassospira sp.]|uniref:adenylate/guanylate cyclase domain-containing protein n=1 Tax=Thalassospira sp. TaxID=1912094 RepID=UPI0027355E7E|nr:adenylate/guanylate cyclase domain-containing protein [Thalassospira sp.]MDP2696890.1 adenylate/guanylate cyclase domain-containing protein [Thalassospira sp.]